MTEEVKKLRAHRCHAALRDSCNQGAKLIKMIEKVRQRQVKTKKNVKGNTAEGVKLGEKTVALPQGFRNLMNVFDESKAGGEAAVFQIAEEDENKLADKLFPHKGSSYGKAFVIDVPNRRPFVSDIKNAQWYNKLTKWIAGYIEEQNTTQAASAIIIPSAITVLQKARREIFPQHLLQDAGFVGSEKTWGRQIFEMQVAPKTNAK